MLKPTVKRGLMLDFIPDEIVFAEKVDYRRIHRLNESEISDGDVLYMPTRELRLEDNWAVIFGQDLAQKHNKTFKIIVIISEIIYSQRQQKLVRLGIEQLKANCNKNNIKFEILDKLPVSVGALIVDFNPINASYRSPTAKWKKEKQYSIFEVDSHNIIPARYISDKQEYSAATLRRKVYANITDFLTEYPKLFPAKREIPIYLSNFIKNKLNSYSENKNNPQIDGTSNLSPYLTFGFLSSQRVAIEVLKSTASRENKEAFLEELIVRKELSDNFCLYAASYKTLQSVPQWAQDTLNAHKSDIRTYIYSKEEFEHAKTHDKTWNKIQGGLIKKGKIHGYSRMIWAKKILEWSKSPEEALQIAIYLNDKYALDGNNPNGYVGILWSIGALHDRPFTNRLVFGKIRYMKGNFTKIEE